MTTIKHDKKFNDKDVEEMLDAASLLPDYPDEEDSLFILKEYDRAARMVFLWVTPNFKDEQRRFIQEYLKEHLSRRTVVSIIRSAKKFGIEQKSSVD